MKFVSIVESLPTYTQVSVLYQVLGSLNSSCINAAAGKVAQDLRDLERATQAAGPNVVSIDKYNELLNELRQKDIEAEHVVEVGFEDPRPEQDYLTLLLTVRKPLLAMFNAAQARLPNRNGGDEADFSFEASLARQLAREYVVSEQARTAEDQALIEQGAITAEELEAADKARFDRDQTFRSEFKFLILDKLNETEITDASTEEGDDAWNELSFEFHERMLKRILPKLIDGRASQLGRRSYDPDATTNILILGLAINEIKKYLGDSEADDKLKKMQAAMAA